MSGLHQKAFSKSLCFAPKNVIPHTHKHHVSKENPNYPKLNSGIGSKTLEPDHFWLLFHLHLKDIHLFHLNIQYEANLLNQFRENTIYPKLNSGIGSKTPSGSGSFSDPTPFAFDLFPLDEHFLKISLNFNHFLRSYQHSLKKS